MNHAGSTPRATSAPPPRLLPRPPGQVHFPSLGTLEAGISQADLGDPASSKGGVSGSLPAGLRPREPLIHCESGGQRIGRRLAACAHYLRATPRPCLWRLATPWGPGTKTVIHSLNSKQLVPSPCQAEATQQGLCHMSACRELT